MSETPRLRSAFPATPRSEFRRNDFDRSPRQGFQSSSFSSSTNPRPSPIIKPVREPLDAQSSVKGSGVLSDWLSAPEQRFYAICFYIILTGVRLHNAWNVEGATESTWLFLLWTGIDAAVFLSLQTLRIPWLEWSFATTLSVWLLHAIGNAFLMYNIVIPIFPWIAALVKVAYNREISVSEHSVNPASILQNSSIILGKQIIHILPEGFAILNPEKASFCLDASTSSVELPIQINQTSPISLEILRYDWDSDEVETIEIGARQAKQMKKNADRGYSKSDASTPRTLRYAVSKPGLYQLQRVIDESKLDVRKRSFDVAVVKCPQAIVSATTTERCTGDLSNVSLQVSGVPPFKVRYSKKIEHHQFSSNVQSIQPTESDNDYSSDVSSNVVLDPRKPQSAWTKAVSVSVDINESLQQNGSWSYIIEDVEDGLGNRVVYEMEKIKDMTDRHRIQSLRVHNRPKVRLVGCDSEHFLRVAKEDAVKLPLQIQSPARLHSSDWPLSVKYTFSPESEADIPAVEEFIHEMSDERAVPRISKAGRYNIETIDSRFCHGEVAEPSSCLLYNPPQPDLTLEKEDIYDKCAGNPIGMIVNLDFTGTPPFKVRYTTTYQGKAQPKIQHFNSMRGQLEFRERSAGSYIYTILEIEDEVYGPISLKSRDLTLQQNIKPPASAMFVENINVVNTCLGQSVPLQVKLLGEGPWDLDYEVVHGGKRKKSKIHADSDTYTIMFPEQSEGGRHSIVLTGVQDKSKCRTALKEERHIDVRPEQPRAAFGDLEGKRSILALEDKEVKLPLRLKGLPPWTVKIQNIDEPSSPTIEQTFKEPNSVISVKRPGTYEIVSVHDTCPGVVDPKASMFTVTWIARPALSMKDLEVTPETSRIFRKNSVCQADESALALELTGNPPYQLKYQQKFEPLKGSVAVSNKQASFAGNGAWIHFDTAKAGEYTYTFSELSDERYAHDKKRFAPLVVKQQVYAPPSAVFAHPGKTYGYCKEDPSFDNVGESEFENIPISLTGQPPFVVEIAITHHGIPRPEIVRIKDILSTSYSWSLSRSTLELGQHSISIRSVKDGRGCESVVERDSSAVRISVSSPPTIIPLEPRTDYCVGDFVSFSLSGQAPFEVYYNFQGREKKARVTTNEFKRIAESPGDFVVTGVSDNAISGGKCRARKEIRKDLHSYPSVKISQGQTMISDIHEGGEVDILFEFTGAPPFEFTYTRSENAKKGQKSRVLETRHDTSNTFSKTIRASDEGTYEVVAIKDRYCAYASPNHAVAKGGKAQKLLQ